MPFINQISHPDELAQLKVNFFADYFTYASNQIGNFDGFEIENYLFLVEKIIYQIEQNIERSAPYLNSYISHPFFLNENKYFKEFKSYRSIKGYFYKYMNSGSDGQRISWIKRTPGFLRSLYKFESELNKIEFKNALNSIISFLRCPHELSQHSEDIIHYTNILVSKFLLNDTGKSDITKVFEKIISKEVKNFPFPQSFLAKNKKEDLAQAKSEFLNNRNFNQQFEGIYNLYKQPPKRQFYLFRICNISALDTFSFKYNKVTFLHPNHPKLKKLVFENRINGIMKDYFKNDQMLIAVVKVQYYSSEIADENAIRLISEELKYLNIVCEANAYVDIHSYLTTSNFLDTGERWSRKSNGHVISKFEQRMLQDNPYNFLKNVDISLKQHLLFQEPLFITAINSNDVADYWQYLETLIKPFDNNVKDTIATILLLNFKDIQMQSIENYIRNCMTSFHHVKLSFGLSYKRLLYFQKKLNSNSPSNFKRFFSEVNHPFINYLSSLYNADLTKEDFKKKKQYYMRILVETYATRNSITHKGYGNEKSLISIHYTLPKLINRFRWILFDELTKKNSITFEDILDKLKIRGQKLL